VEHNANDSTEQGRGPDEQPRESRGRQLWKRAKALGRGLHRHALQGAAYAVGGGAASVIIMWLEGRV